MEEVFKKTSKRLKLATAIFLVVLISLIALHFIIKKTIDNTVDLKQNLEKENKEDLITIKRGIRNYEKHRGVIENLLIDKDQVFSFIGDVENIASNSGLVPSIQSIELYDVLTTGEVLSVTTKEAKGRSHGKLSMVVSVSGDWDSVISFLIKLENIPKHVEVDALRLSSVFDSVTKNYSWTASFSILATTN